MEKVVVTGGAGFIGSNLAEQLVRRGYDVTILDNLSTGRLENIAGLLGKSQVRFVEGSILDLPLLQRVFQGVRYVFHQAALPRVPRSIEDPMTAHEANITGTLSVLLAARDCKVKKVVYASSSSVYGGNPTLPQHEDLPPNPLSPYAVTKLAGEHYCKVFRLLYGLPAVSLRYFNVYGPRQDPTSQYATAIAAFARRISQNEPPLIDGDGEQSRDITFVGDVVEANILAAENNAEGVYNIGSGQSITINRLAGLIMALMGKNLTPVHRAPRPGDPRSTRADITRARSFGWEPKWTLEKGLAETIGDFELALGGHKEAR